MWLPVQVAVVILLGTVASQSYPDVCSSSPCLNGGSCLSSNGNIYCFCPQAVYGDRCQMSFCKELKKAAMGRDICSLYKPNATCVGDILSGQFCQCPLGFTGLFCHERTYIEGDPTTPCDRQKQLYDFALKILNTSYTSDRIVNLLRMNFDLKAALRHIPIIKLPVRKCTANGAFAPIQCQVDIDNISQKTCFCAETNGDIRDGYQESTTEPTGCPDENTKAGCVTRNAVLMWSSYT
ncbi:protein eyes shut homolog [Gigantopelta aegis]|uniref:protein eyes shut homolog n=1 Tax=Gigantopelta aegis TaxID=1735272 RepID=UPI001B888DFD|nr:protein eyes shut homolog [Gigantopelta aegis]